jgi:hypothetical protein
MNWPQLKTVLWLRWRLTRNQWAKSGGLGAVVAVVVAFAMTGLGVVGFGVGAIGGAYGLGHVEPMVIMLIWLGLTAAFLFFWLIGLINELQRSETIDLQRLMHLPVQLGQIFVVNYVASHLALSIVVIVPTMIGLGIGLALSRGPVMLLLIPLGLSMVFMVTAWTYYLRGWLATLMSNPRRRRAVIMGLSFGIILLVQAPNLYFNVLRRHDSSSRSRANETADQRQAREADAQQKMGVLLTAEKVVPPLWVPAGAKALAEGTAWPALGGILGCIVIGLLGLQRAYVSTVRFYQGSSGGKASAKPAAPRPVGAPAAATGPLLVERRLGAVPEQSAALALATFQSMLRAPEVKMQWGASFIVLLVVGGSLLFRASSNIPEWAQPFAITGLTLFSLFFMVQFLSNQFGFDRDGFRALVLSPVDRRLILIGKNIACLPAPATTSLILITAVTIWMRLSPAVFLSTVCQLIAGLLILGIGGNLLSILMPYRIQPGTMKPTKMPGAVVFMMVLAQFAFPLVMAPVFLAPLIGLLWHKAGGPPAGLVELLLSAVMAAIVGLIYWKALGPLGRLLQRRETTILGVVTVEVE